MAELKEGSKGTEVTKLQGNLKKLGFYASLLDGLFGPGTKGAVEDFQARYGGLKVDGIVGSNTSNAIQVALSSTPPTRFSFFAKFKQIQDDMFASGAADALHFAFLDRGIDEVTSGKVQLKPGEVLSSPKDGLPSKRNTPESPFKKEIPHYPDHLLIKPDGSTLLAHPDNSGKFSTYPKRGSLPPIEDSIDSLGFLSNDIQQACVCIGSFDANLNLKTRWFGRKALENVQFWSAPKFIQIVNLVCQANRRDTNVKIADCNIQGDGKDKTFEELLLDVVSYRKGVLHSNAVAKMFKNFKIYSPTNSDLNTWFRSMTGNTSLKYHGGFGSDAFIDAPNLVAVRSTTSKNPLVEPQTLVSGSNRVSAYDLTRCITMLGWHNYLSSDADTQLPDAQWHSLSSVVKGMGTDTARYVDAAIQELELQNSIQFPVVISKLGFGLDTDDISIDALTYTAFVQFVDATSNPAKLRTFAMAFRIPTTAVDAPKHDTKMAAEVTEIVRRVVTEELA